MTDKKKPNNKDEKANTHVSKDQASMEIYGNTGNNPLFANTNGLSLTHGTCGLNTEATTLKNDYLGLGGKVFENPAISIGQGAFTGATYLTPNLNSGMANITDARLTVASDSHSVIASPSSFASFKNSFDSNGDSMFSPRVSLTKEEIEKLIDKKLPVKKEDGLKEEKVVEIINEVLRNKNKQEEENISFVVEKGLEAMRKEILDGKVLVWHCRCGEVLDEFKFGEDLERIKSYLSEFKKGNFKKCKRKGYSNWFEIRENEIIWLESSIVQKEFKASKDKKFDNQE